MSWGIWIVRGIASIVFGLLTLVMPAASLAALVFMFGLYAIIDGVVMIALAFEDSRGRWAYILRGLLGIAAGVFTFMSPGLTAISLYILIGAWALGAGVVEVIAAIVSRKQLPHYGGLILTGVLTSAFGAVLLARPLIGVLALLGFIAGYAILNGITVIGIGMNIHRLDRQSPTLAAA
jgi:uncharacterized membrane protein HdeD (DUF308 family)